MSSVYVNTTFVMNLMRIFFVPITNEKFFRLFYLLNIKDCVYLSVPNITVVKLY